MNPPESQNPEYDRGYRDGYRDRGINQVINDLVEIRDVQLEDLEYLSQMCQNLPSKYRKLFQIKM